MTTAKNSWIGHQQKRLPKLLDWAPAETRPAKLLDWAPAETRLAKLLDWAPAETIQFELLENSRPPALARYWQLSYLEKGPFDLGIENFPLRNETSPASFSTSEQVHSRGTEHIFQPYGNFSTPKNFKYRVLKAIFLSLWNLGKQVIDSRNYVFVSNPKVENKMNKWLQSKKKGYKPLVHTPYGKYSSFAAKI